MENKIMLFKNEAFGEIRTVEENGKILFCGKDIAKALSYSDTVNALKQHCLDDGVVFHHLGVETGKKSDGSPSIQQISMKFISEGNVYRLITHSKLPTAVKFEKWVFDEVLPTIRKTGGYTICQDSYMIADPIARAKKWIEEETVRVELQKTIEIQKPLVEFANQVSSTKDTIDIGTLAKLINDEDIKIGRNRLFKILREKEIIMSNNHPYQKYINSGWFELVEVTKDTPYGVKVFTKIMVTGKGQISIVEMMRDIAKEENS